MIFRLRIVTTVFAALLAIGRPLTAQDAERSWLPDPDLVTTIGERGPVEFGIPLALTAGPEGGFAIADLGDYSVRRFSRSGDELWASGRLGEGPGEFAAFSDLAFLPTGELAVLDPEIGRITVLSESGEFVETIRTPDRVRRLLPSDEAADRWRLAPRNAEDLWVSITAEGARAASLSLPSEVRPAAPILGEQFTASSDSGAVIAWRWSSRLALLDREGRVRRIVPGVEPIDFPALDTSIPGVLRVDRSAPTAAMDVSVANGRVYVLFAGTTRGETGIVDVYAEDDGRYLGSLRVPRAVQDIAVLEDGRLATLEAELIPVVRIWTIQS